MSPDVVDRLYSLPLEEFTPQRDLAARELRRAGDREAAGQLAKLPKPTPAAWTANQVTREHPDLIDELLAAGEALRHAQEDALSGGGGRGLRHAMAEQRRAVDAVMDAAQSYRPAGRALSRAMADRLRTTLQAAAGDEGLTAVLAAGRLVDEAQAGGAWPVGFEVPASAETAVAKTPRARKPRTAGDDEDTAEAAAAAGAAERERAEREALETELRQARGTLRVRERAVAAAQQEAEEAREAAEAAAERLEAARQRAEDAQAEGEAAAQAARDAAEALEAVRDAVARLEERLD